MLLLNTPDIPFFAFDSTGGLSHHRSIRGTLAGYMDTVDGCFPEVQPLYRSIFPFSSAGGGAEAASSLIRGAVPRK